MEQIQCLPAGLVDAGKFECLVQSLRSGHRDVGLHSNAFPVLSGIGIEGPPDRNIRHIALAYRNHRSEVIGARRRLVITSNFYFQPMADDNELFAIAQRALIHSLDGLLMTASWSDGAD